MSAWPVPGAQHGRRPGLAGRAAADLPALASCARPWPGNHSLLTHSRPIMEYLFDQVRHSHSVVVLADRAGMLMHTLGSPGFMDKAERVAPTCGASWHESHRGTNAIGTALAEGNGGGGAWRRAFSGAQQLSHLRGLAHPSSATGELLGIPTSRATTATATPTPWAWSAPRPA